MVKRKKTQTDKQQCTKHTHKTKDRVTITLINRAPHMALGALLRVMVKVQYISVDCWPLNVKRKISHAYSGREQVR
jgi:hypothetical protein